MISISIIGTLLSDMHELGNVYYYNYTFKSMCVPMHFSMEKITVLDVAIVTILNR